MNSSTKDKNKLVAGVILAVIALALSVYFLSQAHYSYVVLSFLFGVIGLMMINEATGQK
jgi:hypothetical protein